jgi:hypothetical protein
MTDEERIDTTNAESSGAEKPEGSVFANLPRERPGVRSPRRDAAASRRTRDATTSRQTSAARAAAEASSPRARPEPRTAPRAERPPEPGTDEEAGGLEDIAWAGVTVAAEAATLGVRLAGRALGAMRGAVGRR